jgi:Protein of unknown function (DUF664)
MGTSYASVGDLQRYLQVALALDAVGEVPWWPKERREVTLHRILVHMIAETHRHADHADIVRELNDGAVGLRKATTTWRRAIRPGGSATAVGWSVPRGRPARPEAPLGRRATRGDRRGS